MLKVSVISPEALVFEGDADAVVAPAFDGDMGILSGHAPMMTLLGKGTLRVGSSGSERKFTIEGGFLQIAGDVVRVVTEKAAAS